MGQFRVTLEAKMDEIIGKYDENDPKIKEKLEFLRGLNAETKEKIASWQDAYDNLKRLAYLYMEDPCKDKADMAILVMLSFVLALEQLPEEGDILTLCYRTNEIMVMREDLTKATVFVGAEAENARAAQALMGTVAASALLAKLVKNLEAAADTQGSKDGVPADGKKGPTFH